MFPTTMPLAEAFARLAIAAIFAPPPKEPAMTKEFLRARAAVLVLIEKYVRQYGDRAEGYRFDQLRSRIWALTGCQVSGIILAELLVLANDWKLLACNTFRIPIPFGEKGYDECKSQWLDHIETEMHATCLDLIGNHYKVASDA